MEKHTHRPFRTVLLTSLAVLACVCVVLGILLLVRYMTDLRTNDALGSSLSMLRKDAESASTPSASQEEASGNPDPSTSSQEGSLGNAPIKESTTGNNPLVTIAEEMPAYFFSDNDFLSLFRINPDTIGWLKIGDTRIDYPVVKGVDNEFYLDHGFDKAPNVAGAVFMDTRNIGDGTDRHTLIYGHRMKDGSMFRDLEKYQDEAFYSAHREFELQTLHGIRRYRVFSTYVTDTDFLFIKTRFEDNTFSTFLKEIQDKSLFPSEQTDLPDENSKILTLATCSRAFADARFVVHAVLLESDDP